MKTRTRIFKTSEAFDIGETEREWLSNFGDQLIAAILRPNRYVNENNDTFLSSWLFVIPSPWLLINVMNSISKQTEKRQVLSLNFVTNSF